MSDDGTEVGLAGKKATDAEATAGPPDTVSYCAESATLPLGCVSCPGCHQSLTTSELVNGGIRCRRCGISVRLHFASPELTAATLAMVGRFELLERVGQGSFGTVWRARDTTLDRVVALKIPHKAAIGAGVEVERLEREARVAAQLRHPGIVRLYEVLSVDGQVVLVSDFIEGMPLKQLLELRRPTIRESALLVAQVAEALHHAHERGLVHRDVKPANIMMEQAGGAGDSGEISADSGGVSSLGRPIVVDFGLALRPEADIVMTVEGQIVGTPAYMSPEQASGRSHHVDRRSDVYSLGVVLYQLLSDALPFHGPRLVLLDKILYEDPKPPRRPHVRIPRDLETICLKALAKAPSRRFQTAGELAADLRRFLRGEPCLARPVGPLERGWLWALRNRALAAARAAVLALLILVVVVSLRFGVREKQNADHLRAALDQSNYRLAESYLVQGIGLCERAEVARGMLLLARALSAAPESAADLDRVLRTNLTAWAKQLDPLVVQHALGAAITAVGFSPDGKLAVAASGQSVRVWDHPGAVSAGDAIDCDNEVVCLAFKPGGQEVAIGCADGRVRIWNFRLGRFLPAMIEHGQKVYSIAYSHDGKTLATGGFDSQLKFWETASGRRHACVLKHDGRIEFVAFAPDDKTVVTATEGGKIQLWDAATGAMRREAAAPKPIRLSSAALSPDGRWLAIGGGPRSATIWDATELRLIHRLPHAGVVEAVAFSPDSLRLLTGEENKVARLWDVQTGDCLGVVANHRQSIKAVAFSPDGGLILTASDDGVCQFRQPNLALPRCRELVHRAPVGIVAFSPDSGTALTGTKTLGGKSCEVQLWDVFGNQAPRRVTHSGMITKGVFSPDGRIVATASADGTCRLVDTDSGNLLGAPLQHDGWVHDINFNLDGTRVLTGSEDGSARLWEVPTGRFLGRKFTHEQAVLTAALNPDGTLALTASADGTARLWDVSTGRVCRLFPHRSLVRSAAFDPAGKLVLTASFDHTARVWRVDSGVQVGSPFVHQDEVLCATFSPDGATVLTGSKDKTAQLWSVSTSSRLGRPLMHDGPIYAVAISPDSATVATASGDATVRLWDLSTGRPVGPSLRHRGPVSALAFSPDRDRLITGSRDNTARIWDLPGAFEGPPGDAIHWVEIVSGVELTANEALTPLSPDAWADRSRSHPKLRPRLEHDH